MTAVLITGGTGSMGQALTTQLLTQPAVTRICVYSRDEVKQSEMRQRIQDVRVRYFIGDVRDRQRLTRAMHHVDHVIHAAALKQVPACEYNPLEAKKTNIDGTANVIEAAIDAQVGRVLMLSSDKACDPTNLYGATKLVAEKLIVDANAYGGHTTKFACTRYGNVLGSRGSVLPLFQTLHAAKRPLIITDPTMTRFVLTLGQGVRFVLDSLERMAGGEVFVPKLPSVSVRTIAEAVTWPYEPGMIIDGLRPGEKRHELLISAHEAPRTSYYPDHCVIGMERVGTGAEGAYGSDMADRLDVDGFRELAGLGATIREVA